MRRCMPFENFAHRAHPRLAQPDHFEQLFVRLSRSPLES
jgi:hypothetical protein